MSRPDHNDRRFRQNPREPSFFANPYPLYAHLHAAGDPMFWENYGVWCLAGFESVNAALRDRRLARIPPPESATEMPKHLADFADVERHSLLCLEPPEHRRLRRRVNPAFLSREIRRLESAVRVLAEAGVDRIESGCRRAADPVDLIEHLATPLPVTIIARLIGVPEVETEQLLEWSHAMVRVYTLTQTHEEEVAANEAAKAFQNRLLELIKEKRRTPADDLLSRLAADDGTGEGSGERLNAGTNEDFGERANERACGRTNAGTNEDIGEPANEDSHSPLTDAEIVSLAILLLNAGHEATVHQIGNAVLTLLQRPADAEPAASLLASAERRDRTVTELLRFDPPLHLFLRYAHEPVELGSGVILERGQRVALLLAAANRDPARFENPERFDPDRDDGAQLSLGAGIHHCVGAPLARLELGVALSTLFERLPDLRVAGELSWRDSYHFRGLECLPVRCR